MDTQQAFDEAQIGQVAAWHRLAAAHNALARLSNTSVSIVSYVDLQEEFASAAANLVVRTDAVLAAVRAALPGVGPSYGAQEGNG